MALLLKDHCRLPQCTHTPSYFPKLLPSWSWESVPTHGQNVACRRHYGWPVWGPWTKTTVWGPPKGSKWLPFDFWEHSQLPQCTHKHGFTFHLFRLAEQKRPSPESVTDTMVHACHQQEAGTSNCGLPHASRLVHCAHFHQNVKILSVCIVGSDCMGCAWNACPAR